MEAIAADVLEQYPGAERDGDTIDIAPGVAYLLPQAGPAAAGEVGAQAAPNCGYEWFCVYEHRDYGGSGLGFYRCNTLYDLFDHFFTNSAGQRDDWAYDISSWHNNQSGGAAAWMYQWGGGGPASGPLYRANVGAVPDIGNDWNDLIIELYAC